VGVIVCVLATGGVAVVGSALLPHENNIKDTIANDKNLYIKKRINLYNV
jgi:hypothetical protein